MAADPSPEIVRTVMNECLKLVSGGGRTNVRVWVSGASAAAFTESTNYEKAGALLRPMFDAHEQWRAGSGDAKHLFILHHCQQ